VARHKSRTRAGSGSNDGEVLLARTLACPDYDYPGRGLALTLNLCSETRPSLSKMALGVAVERQFWTLQARAGYLLGSATP
jgi:hypothetical protein